MITITEALAEIKTIDKRVDKKKEFILANIARQQMLVDPLAKQGGSEQVLKYEIQSIGDLLERSIQLRARINKANQDNFITILGITRSIANWITWKRDVSETVRGLWDGINSHIGSIRAQAQAKGARIGVAGTVETPQDVVVHVDLKDVASQRERLEEILGVLDGQLSLKNATIMIDDS